MLLTCDGEDEESELSPHSSLELGNSDVMLGIQWLEKLGTMTANWKTQTIRFQLGSEIVTLKGDAVLGRSGILLKVMLRNLRKEGNGFLIEFNFLQATSDLNKKRK